LDRTGAINDGLVNAGGGFVTGTRFDGMSFNWDAFFSLFLIRSQEDLNIWRRLMKELAAAEGKLSLQGRDLQIALTKMRQAFGRVDANLKFQQSLESLNRKLQQGPVYELLGQNPDAVPALRKQIEDTLREIYAQAGDKAAPFKGRVYLTDQELDALGATPEQKEAYRAQLTQLDNAGADLATLGLMMDDRTQVRTRQAELQNERSRLAAQAQATPQQQERLREIDAELRKLSEADQRLGQAINAARHAIGAHVAQAMSNPEVAAFLNARRDALSNELSDARAEQHKLRQKELEPNLTEEERAEIQQKSEEAKQREASLLRQIVVLDTAMAEHEIASPEQKEAYDGLLERAQGDLAAAHKAQADYRGAVQAILADQPSESNAQRVERLKGRQGQ
ncbi:MAG: hypothetical protein HYZ27_02010, partial [Deltaproteobacteria bacterium]|nr:hypothetical protein [Deltaproteobacteria bacterium]